MKNWNQAFPLRGNGKGGFPITHITDAPGAVQNEYSYDAWGRRRNALNWSYDLTGQPALFADRGFTSHEFLADFNSLTKDLLRKPMTDNSERLKVYTLSEL